MRVLLDTHIVVAVLDRKIDSLPGQMSAMLRRKDVTAFASIATHWELAIKHRLGKIMLPIDPVQLTSVLTTNGVGVLNIREQHIFADIGTEPGTRDPFDRLLLGVCAAEKLRLITLDRALATHSLAWSEIA